jgi:hypothetical protein
MVSGSFQIELEYLALLNGHKLATDEHRLTQTTSPMLPHLADVFFYPNDPSTIYRSYGAGLFG